MTEEVWKDVVGFEGRYQISNFGNLRGLERKRKSKGNSIATIKARPHFPHIKKPGYYWVNLRDGYKSYNKKIHRLVAEAFIPNPENKCCVNHIDGVKTNNNVENLEWCTLSENSQHMFRIGLHSLRGVRNNMAKLNEEKVRFIKQNHRIIPTKIMAEMFGVGRTAIIEIISGRNWSHITA